MAANSSGSFIWVYFFLSSDREEGNDLCLVEQKLKNLAPEYEGTAEDEGGFLASAKAQPAIT